MKSSPLTRRLVSCLVLPLALLLPRAVHAQQDAGTRDAGSVYDVPDASVGGGGADRDNPEGDDSTGRPGGACRSGNDCAARFSCTQGVCRYTGIRQADRVGCLLGPEDSLAVVGLGLGLALAARRRGGGKP
ncbi:MAG TPA: MXAN_6627.5 family MYXO-CTERM protein [Archangium sp.]|uniref:MXAN_6627.5 family MYXO-CTERM protein n=1 Tax=Archangium sp. TaxID=1872627 RepID=UPI002E37506A|nr:MXAN_6627.5 family MYXO-CTERM protein [Archangium sp.]HEX5749941.1 MXAN_6627.5 family MYXO-CTERM protein [Archangium sp.]